MLPGLHLEVAQATRDQIIGRLKLALRFLLHVSHIEHEGSVRFEKRSRDQIRIILAGDSDERPLVEEHLDGMRSECQIDGPD